MVDQSGLDGGLVAAGYGCTKPEIGRQHPGGLFEVVILLAEQAFEHLLAIDQFSVNRRACVAVQAVLNEPIADGLHNQQQAQVHHHDAGLKPAGVELGEAHAGRCGVGVETTLSC